MGPIVDTGIIHHLYNSARRPSNGNAIQQYTLAYGCFPKV